MNKALPVFLCLLAATAGNAELSAEPSIRSTSLTIGHGWAVVRELRSIALREGEQEILLEGIPPEADLSSLVVRSQRVPLELLECHRKSVSADAVRQGSDVRWTSGKGFAGAAAPDDQSGPVVCFIRSPMNWEGMGLDVSYVINGFDWSAIYQVAVRGEQAEEKEPVSVDLSGLVRIENKTSRSFANAKVLLAGGRARESISPSAGPGFLSLDEDSPLADLWREQPREPKPEFEYDIPQSVSLNAHTATDVVLVRTVRTPATRIYTMVAEDFPPVSEDRDSPLRKRIVLKNISANRMGIALPPGRVQVFLGSQRSRLLQEGFFERTPVNGTIRIDLGLAEDVRGMRMAGRSSDPLVGYFEQSFLVTVRNQRDSDIVCEIDEKPPVILEWNVVSSTSNYSESGHRLSFNIAVRARAEEIIEYKLRIRQPEL
jgi:hypothetical protein